MKILLVSFLLSLVLPASAVGLLLPPFTYVGRIVDADHAGTAGVTVRAWNTRGELVAKTVTYANGATPNNYRLVIPVATTETRGYATVGETLAFEFATSEASYDSLVPAAKCVVGNPGEIVTCDLMTATATSVEGVSDAYLAGIKGTMRRNGKTSWDGAADWDNDGMSNLAEYFAGTNPFNASSKLAVSLAETVSSEDGSPLLSLTFTPVAGRVYSVGRADDLSSGAWSRAPFATTAVGAASSTYYSASDATPVTFYLPRDPARSSGFYRLQVE